MLIRNRIISLSLSGVLALGATVLTGCSGQTASQQTPSDYGYTLDANVRGITLNVSPDWKRSNSRSFGTVFSDAELDDDSAILGGTTALFVECLPAGTAKDINAVEDATGWDMPFGNNFEQTDSWSDGHANYTLSSYESSYGQSYLVLIGTTNDADFSIFARTRNKNEFEGIGVLLRNVSFDPASAIVDKSGLEATLADSGKTQEDYEPEGWDAYASAHEEAKRILSDNKATQEEVDAANLALINAADALVPVPDSGLYQKFDYGWYMENERNRNGKYVGAACMVTRTFQSQGKRYLVATLANDDATLSDHDILLMPSDREDLSGYQVGDALPVFGTTHEMQQVSLQDGYDAALPAIIVTSIAS